jgi:hypothetical protein
MHYRKGWESERFAPEALTNGDLRLVAEPFASVAIG